jgi:hypothetical protein
MGSRPQGVVLIPLRNLHSIPPAILCILRSKSKNLPPLSISHTINSYLDAIVNNDPIATDLVDGLAHTFPLPSGVFIDLIIVYWSPSNGSNHKCQLGKHETGNHANITVLEGPELDLKE